jgi:Lysozyme inhibitor LprI
MRGLSILLLSLALALPALAEVDFRKDPHARDDLALISTCFDAAETWEAAQDCVNLTFVGCLERIGKSASHADEGGCNQRELGLWEHLLAIETRKLEARAVLKDNEIAEAGQQKPYAHQSVLTSLEQWEAYRKAQCAYMLERWGAGTIGVTAEPHCHMDLVVERLFELRPVIRKMVLEARP